MDNLTKGEVKVVCYSGSTEKQLFHFDPKASLFFLFLIIIVASISLQT